MSKQQKNAPRYLVVGMMLLPMMLLFLPRQARGISYPLVQSGTTTIAAANTSSTISFGTAVSTANAFAIVHCTNNRNAGDAPGIFLVSGRLSSDGTQIILERAGSGQIANISYHIIQSTEGISVQHGSVNFASGDSQKDITINNVVLSKSVVILTRRSAATSANHCQTQIRGWLTASNNLRLERGTTGAAVDVEWSVVTFLNNTNVQTGEIIFTNSTIATANLSSAVTLSRAWLSMTVSVEGGSGMAYSIVRGQLTDTSTISFNRRTASATVLPTVRWFVAEFPDGLNASVQKGSIATAATGDTQLGATITSVTQSECFIDHSNDGAGTGTAYPRTYWINRFISDTNVEFQRWYYGQHGTIDWQVVRFPDYIDTTPPSAITNLSALIGSNEGEIELNWTSPGDDGTTGQLIEGSMFKVQYSTWTSIDWSTSNAQISISTSSVNPGEVQSYIVTGLDESTTYYFRIWTKDEETAQDNWSEISNSAYAQAMPYLPAAITNLSALTGESHRTIKLTWTSPGDDGTTGDIVAGKYKIKWSTYTEVDWGEEDWADWENRYKLEFSTDTSPLADQALTITGLSEGATYYFRIWTADETGYYSDISNGATTWTQNDIIAPNTITDLSAQEGVENGSIDLTWTSPGDDNDIGKVNNYVVKYSTAKIVEATWNTSYTYTFGQSWIPQSAGNLEENTITGLIPGAKYYVAIKSQDEVPNTSEISNSPLAFAQVMILSVSVIQPSHDFGIISVSTMVVIYSSTTVINDGNVPVTYSLHCSSSVPTNWAPVSTAPSNNAQFRLLGIFNGSVKPSSAEFNSLDDYLTLTPRAATSDIFSNNETGDNVSINTIRGLWFRIETPLPNPVSTQQTITVTITAEQP